jgi:hypothetical protein
MSYLHPKLATMICASVLLAVPAQDAFARTKPPLPAPTTFNCAAGQSINAAIADGYTVITVRGVCEEVVEITVDNIELLSHPTVRGGIRSGVDAPLNIYGADEIYIDGITVQATGTVTTAVFVEHSLVTFNGVDVTAGTLRGLEARRNASVTFNNGSFTGGQGGALASLSSNLSINDSTISGVTFGGASAQLGAVLQIQGTMIDGTGAPTGVGVNVSSGAFAEIAAGSVISNFGTTGVAATGGGVLLRAATVSDNGGAGPSYPGEGGVVVASGASLEIAQSAVVTGNTGYGVALIDGSGGNCSASTISDNDTNLFVSAGSEFGSGAICVTP